MVIGERFVWAHLPKTGGDATLTFFLLFPELIRFADPASTNDKHLSFSAREGQVAGKLRLSNFRRLPAWMLSHAQHESRYWYGQVVAMPPADEIASRTLADEKLRYLTDNGRFNVGRWLRTEFLADDFLHFVEDLTDVGEARAERVRQHVMINAMDYDHEIRRWFKPDLIAEMYRRNPFWAELERELYGATFGQD